MQLLARGWLRRLVLRAVTLEELRVVQHVVEARGALEGGDLLEQLPGWRVPPVTPWMTIFWPVVGEVADLQHGGEDGDQQRHGDQHQADQHQSAQ